MKIPAPAVSGKYELYFVCGNVKEELCAVNSAKILIEVVKK